MINLLLGLGVATTLLTTVAPAKNNGSFQSEVDR